MMCWRDDDFAVDKLEVRVLSAKANWPAISRHQQPQ